jgi:hypothetical protein
MFDNSADISVLRSVDRYRRFLIMIRCGASARPSLFHGPLSNERNFDVAVNYYSPPHPDDFFYQGAEFLVAGGLSKFQAAKQLMHLGLLDKYEGLYFLDEDIELHFEPSRFLDYCSAKGFAIAQASLTHPSDGAWKITFNHPAFEYRLTNFVEVMAPYFSREFMMNVVESFDISISTYGLDVFWGSQLEADQTAAIIDVFQMSHLKKRDFSSGAYYGYLRSLGIDCFKEMKDVLASLGIESYQIRLKGWVDIVESVRVA